MARKLEELEDENQTATPVPKFEEPTVTVPVGIRSSVRHPETGILCFSPEEWEEQEKIAKEKLK